jgi:hypothetical protein
LPVRRGSRLVVETCRGFSQCPTVVRERLLLAIAGEGIAPRLVGDVVVGGRWVGFVRELVPGEGLDTVVLRLLEEGRLNEASELVYRAGFLLGVFHRRAACLAGLFPRIGAEGLLRSIAGWAGFMAARGWVLEARLLLGVLDGLELGSAAGLVVFPHGDVHFGQFVLRNGGGLVLIDYRGEPFRPSWWLFRSFPAERDLASLLRSLDYLLALAGCRRWGLCYQRLCRSLLRGYIGGSGYWPSRSQLWLWMLERLGYEVFFEAVESTGFEWIPLSALQGVVAAVWDCSG